MKRIAAVCGSLRAGSYNRCLLKECQRRCASAGIEVIEVEFSGFPLYNADVDAAGPPADVLAAKRLIQSCDALLLVSPEYNYGVPGALKNAIDWLSRPSGDPTLFGRPMAVMGASSGYMGTMRSQLAWRQMWHFFRAPVFSAAEMTVSFAAKAFDDDGRLVSPDLSERLDMYLAELGIWLEREACEGS